MNFNRCIDIRQYRRKYYKENKDYLLAYQRWYYSNRRAKLGIIKESEIHPKPDPNTRKFTERKKQSKMMTRTYGNFTIKFE